MKPAYKDILALTDRSPIWWDENGVPRYAPFHPSMLGVYDQFAILAEIACQSCPALLLVGKGSTCLETQALPELVAGFIYGDPPRHNCPGAGETMSSEEVRVVEAWEKERFEWVRRPEMEGPFVCCRSCQYSIARDGEHWIDVDGHSHCPGESPDVVFHCP